VVFYHTPTGGDNRVTNYGKRVIRFSMKLFEDPSRTAGKTAVPLRKTIGTVLA
jgi:hypothetical protein